MTAVPETRSFEWTRGERLAKARKVAQFTQETMAEMMTEHGIPTSPFAIATWETDRSQPRKMMEVYQAWSEITGAPMEWLLGLTVRTGSILEPVPSPVGHQGSLDDLLHPRPELASV